MFRRQLCVLTPVRRDWLYSLTSPHGVVFTNELRDTGQTPAVLGLATPEPSSPAAKSLSSVLVPGTFGFVLPDSEIRPTGEEQVAALKVQRYTPCTQHLYTRRPPPAMPCAARFGTGALARAHHP